MLIRQAKQEDISAVVEIDYEDFSPYGTAEKPETFQYRLQAFRDGFIVLVLEDEIAAYGCSEKWLVEREPERESINDSSARGEDILYYSHGCQNEISEEGYGLLVVDKLIEIARKEGCAKIVLETTHA